MGDDIPEKDLTSAMEEKSQRKDQSPSEGRTPHELSPCHATTDSRSPNKLQVWNRHIVAEMRASIESENDDGSKLSPSKLNLEKKRRAVEKASKARRELERREEKLERLEKKRLEDKIMNQKLLERSENQKVERAARFEEAMNAITLQEGCRDTAFYLDREMERLIKKKNKVYNNWKDNTFDPANDYVQLCINPRDRIAAEKAAELERGRSTDLQSKTVRFQEFPHCSTPDIFSKDATRLGVSPVRRSGRKLATTRPVLEPVLWGQLAIQPTPYGHFAQLCEIPGYHKGDKKRDRFTPIEMDGISIAGKKTTRWGRNNLGVLEPGMIRGEGALRKNAAGRSSGVLMGDHYSFETGRFIIDKEFPVGKRIFPHKH